jgi:hypothetical protein
MESLMTEQEAVNEIKKGLVDGTLELLNIEYTNTNHAWFISKASESKCYDYRHQICEPLMLPFISSVLKEILQRVKFSDGMNYLMVINSKLGTIVCERCKCSYENHATESIFSRYEIVSLWEAYKRYYNYEVK